MGEREGGRMIAANITAWNQEGAIDVAKLMQRGAEYAAKDYSLSEIEQAQLINQFCQLRDGIEIKSPLSAG